MSVLVNKKLKKCKYMDFQGYIHFYFRSDFLENL